MKILRLYYLLPPKVGGMERHIYNLSKTQNENNSVKIIFNHGEKVNNEDVRVLPFIKLFKIRPLAIGIVLFYVAVISELLFKKQNFDIIHIHGDWSSLLFIKLMKKMTNATCIVFSIHDQLTNKYTHQTLLPKLVQDVDLIFSTGYDTATELEVLSGKKITVQPSGVNDFFYQEFKKTYGYDKFTIVTVANLFLKKNIKLVLEIAQELQEYRFIIVGDGAHRDILENIIKSKGVSNVELVGFKNTLEVREYYQKSDCYLLTSFAEGTPTSALEAMACGLPIVSSNAGGLSNIVKENENGFIINNFDKNSYIEKINFIKDNTNLRKEMFEANILLSKNYTWGNVVKNITKKMEETLHAKYVTIQD